MSSRARPPPPLLAPAASVFTLFYLSEEYTMTFAKQMWRAAPLLALLAACDSRAPTDAASGGPPAISADRSGQNASAPTGFTVFATGLDNPRGLEFGPDGSLYVAEGGRGGTTSTAGQCTQVVPPVGPYTSGMTARISRINRRGERTTVVDQLPSSQTSPALGSEISGVADVTFIGHTLYALLAGAGCSHGVKDMPNGVIRVGERGHWSLVADLSTYQQTHPVAHPEADDFEPDGTWYDMLAVHDRLIAVEPNHGEVVAIGARGGVRRIVDISASQGHIVPTALALHGGLYVSNLGTFPVVPGTELLMQVTPSGRLHVRRRGLTAVLGLAFDKRERLYALETTGCTGQPCFPTPGTGRVVRVAGDGTLQTVVSGLTTPTAMAFGPDDKLYISNFGYGAPAGAGQIVRAELRR